MQRKIRLPVAANDVLTFLSADGSSPKHIKLMRLRMDDNKLEWYFTSTERHSMFGSNARARARLPYFNNDSWICLSLPIRIHPGADGLKAEFIVNVPTSVDVQRNHLSSKGLFE